jgi:hypothetical protein
MSWPVDIILGILVILQCILRKNRRFVPTAVHLDEIVAKAIIDTALSQHQAGLVASTIRASQKKVD